MAWLIGVDEAGYGPNLGPLSIGATAWRVRDAGADLYELLASTVSPRVDGDRIAIADSKQLYKPRGGLVALERAVHAAVDSATSYSRLIESLGADPAASRLGLPWHAGFDAALPLDIEPKGLAALRIRLADGCESVGVARPIVRARLVFPAEFNDLVDRYETKGAALSHVTLALVRELVDGLDGPIDCTLDKHGGRNRYGALIQHHFPEHWLETIAESRAESVYHWGDGDARVTFTFCSQGERFLPTALASMTAKYLRELSMKALNEYWAQHTPGLRPTAGYPVDAKRFKREIAPAQEMLGVQDRILWRNR